MYNGAWKSKRTFLIDKIGKHVLEHGKKVSKSVLKEDALKDFRKSTLKLHSPWIKSIKYLDLGQEFMP